MKNRGIQKLRCSQYDKSETKNHLWLNNDSRMLNANPTGTYTALCHPARRCQVTPSALPSSQELHLEVTSPVLSWRYRAIRAENAILQQQFVPLLDAIPET
jgi:hypothetical protein